MFRPMFPFRHPLGKLCVTINQRVLLKPPNHVLEPEVSERFGVQLTMEEFKERERLVRKRFARQARELSFEKWNFLKWAEILRLSNLDEQVCEIAAQEVLASHKPMQSDSGELYEDVKPFLELVRASESNEWPFKETLIFGTTSDIGEGSDYISPMLARQGVQTSAMEAHHSSPPCYLDGITQIYKNGPNIFHNIRKNLWNIRTDHLEFRHLYITTRLLGDQGILAARAAGLAVLQIKRPGDARYREMVEEDPEKIYNSSFPLSIHQSKRVPRKLGFINSVRQMPTIVDLRAIKNWRPRKKFTVVLGDYREEFGGEEFEGEEFRGQQTIFKTRHF